MPGTRSGAARVGSTTDIILGRVTGPDSLSPNVNAGPEHECRGPLGFTDSAIAKIADVRGSVGANPDPQTTVSRMRGNVQAGRRMAEQAAKDLEAILTPEQWTKLPPNVKNPLMGARGQQGEGPVRIEMHGPPPE